MIIYLGRRLPDASSDLPGSRDGSGRSVSGGRWGTDGLTRVVPSRPFTLPPYLVLLPMGFTEPGRSPGLLVSSYLAVSPLPRSGRGEATRPRRSIFCGTVPIRTAFADPDGGRYPPSRPVESGLSSAARPRTQAFRPVGFPPGHRARAQAPRRSSRPPRTLTSSYGSRFARTTLSHWSLVIGHWSLVKKTEGRPSIATRLMAGFSPWEPIGLDPSPWRLAWSAY
jgi:hypothetical protein